MLDIEGRLFFLLLSVGVAYFFYRGRVDSREPREALLSVAREAGWSNLRWSKWSASVSGEYNEMKASSGYYREQKHDPAMLVTNLFFQCGVDLTIRRRPQIDESDWLHKPLPGSRQPREASLPDALAREFIVECKPGAQMFADRIFDDHHLVGVPRRTLGDDFDTVWVDKEGAHVRRKSRDSVAVYRDMNRLAEMARLAFELLTRIHRAISLTR